MTLSCKLSSLFVFLTVAVSLSQTQINVFSPLLTPVTTVELQTITTTSIKPTPCFITSGEVSVCRKRRGKQEEPEIINPSSVAQIQVTELPELLNDPKRYSQQFDPDIILSPSIINFQYHWQDWPIIHFYRQILSNNNLITVGPNCAGATVDLSQLLQSCLGVTVQTTTTLTATLIETVTLSTGYTTITVGGCMPTHFPYSSCRSTTSSDWSTLIQQTTIFPSPAPFKYNANSFPFLFHSFVPY